jgi:hypothetical protein
MGLEEREEGLADSSKEDNDNLIWLAKKMLIALAGQNSTLWQPFRLKSQGPLNS